MTELRRLLEEDLREDEILNPGQVETPQLGLRDLLEQDLQQEALEEDRASRRTPMGWARNLARAPVEGAAGAAGGIVEGMGLDVERARRELGMQPRSLDDVGTVRAGRAITEAGREWADIDPDYEGTFALDAARGGGSLAAFAGLGLLGRGAGMATAAARGQQLGRAGQMASQMTPAVTAAQFAGVSEAHQHVTQFMQDYPELAAEAGLTEETALDLATGMQPRVAGTVQVASIVSLLRPLTGTLPQQTVRRMIETGFNEFVVENMGAAIQNNLRQTYDPDHPLWEEIPYRGETAGVGAAALALLMSPLNRRGRRVGTGATDAGATTNVDHALLNALAEEGVEVSLEDVLGDGAVDLSALYDEEGGLFEDLVARYGHAPDAEVPMQPDQGRQYGGLQAEATGTAAPTVDRVDPQAFVPQADPTRVEAQQTEPVAGEQQAPLARASDQQTDQRIGRPHPAGWASRLGREPVEGVPDGIMEFRREMEGKTLEELNDIVVSKRQEASRLDQVDPDQAYAVRAEVEVALQVANERMMDSGSARRPAPRVPDTDAAPAANLREMLEQDLESEYRSLVERSERSPQELFDEAGDRISDQAVPRRPQPLEDPRLQLPEYRDQLQPLAGQAGSEVGGRMIRDQDGEVTGRTQPLPFAPWWESRPKNVSRMDMQRGARKALAGERLSANERRAVLYLLELVEIADVTAYSAEVQQFQALADETAVQMDYSSDAGELVLMDMLQSLEAEQQQFEADRGEYEQFTRRDDAADAGATGEDVTRGPQARTRGREGAGRADQRGEAARPARGVGRADPGVTEEAGGQREALSLEATTPEQLRAQEAEAQRREQEEQRRREREQADAEVDDFQLTGSDRAADAIPGQMDLTDQTQAPTASEPSRPARGQRSEPAQPESTDADYTPLWEQLPEGLDASSVRFESGRGLNKDKVKAVTDTTESMNYHATPEAALADLVQRIKADQAAKEREATRQKAEQRLVEKLKAGKTPEGSEWAAVVDGIEPSHRYVRQPVLSSFLVRNFAHKGFTKGSIRKHLGAAAGTLTSDTGATYPIIYLGRLPQVLADVQAERRPAEGIPQLTKSQKSARTTINRVVKPENADGYGTWAQGATMVDASLLGDGDLEISISIHQQKFSGPVTEHKFHDRKLRMSELEGHLSEEARLALEQFKYEAEQTLRDEDPKFSMRPVRERHETMAEHGLRKGETYKTRQIGAALQDRQRKKFGTIERDDRSPKSARKIANWMVDEILHEMDNPSGSGVGWYSQKFQNALDTLGQVFPELTGTFDRSLPGVKKLQSRQNARDFLTALIAVTSDGQTASINLSHAAESYDVFRRTGELPTGVVFGGTRNTSIRGNFQTLQKMLDEHGPRKMHQRLLQERTVSEFRQLARQEGEEFRTQYPASETLPYAALVLGPKLGAFYANLMGSTGYLTMDLWWSRTFNRYRGQLIPQVKGLADSPTDERGNKIGVARFKELIGHPEMSDEEAILATIPLERSYAAKGYKNGTEAEKAGNTIYKEAFVQLEDSPFNISDRGFMIDATRRAQRSLQRQGHDLSIADIQAILWYYEKRLYAELGARETADESYEEVAPRIVAHHREHGGWRPKAGGSRADVASETAPVAEDREAPGRFNLYVAHNLSESNLHFANELGGLPAPSFAVARADKGFESFGEITLLADPALLQDKQVKLFDADIYSPRQPRPEYPIEYGKWKAFEESLGDLHGLRRPDMEAAERGAQDMAREESVKLGFLREIGKAPKTKLRKVSPELKKAARLGLNGPNEIRSDARVQDLAERFYRKDYERSINGLVENGMSQAEAEELMHGTFWNEDGSLKRGMVNKFASQVWQYQENEGVDIAAFEAAINKALRPKLIQKRYENWVRKKHGELHSGARMFKGFTDAGNRRYSPYTLNNVMREMVKKLQGGEGFNYGPGSIRAMYANEIRSLKEAQNRRDQIVTAEEMDKIREESGERVIETLDKLKPYYRFDASGFGYLDDASTALAEGRSGWRETFDLDAEGEKMIVDLLEYLRGLPTQYFEAKAKRVVDIGEFSLAVVPKDIGKETLDLLKGKGVRVVKYDPEQDGARQAAIAEQEALLFSRWKVTRPQPQLLDPRVVQEALSGIVSNLTVPVVVYGNAAEASAASGVTVPETAHGFFYQGKIGIIAASHATVQDAEGTLWHEIKHAGVGRIFKGDTKAYLRAMNQIHARNANVRREAAEWQRHFGAEFRAVLEQVGITGKDAESRVRARATEEALADLSKAHGREIKLQGLRKMINQVVQFLRAHGFKALPDYLERVSDAEALGMIMAAREAVSEGGAVMFMGRPTGMHHSRTAPKRDALGFYSSLSRAIQQSPTKMDGAKAKQWASWLQSNAGKMGVKKEELHWSGVMEWLDLQEGPVAAEDIQAYLEQGGVQVEEVVLGQPDWAVYDPAAREETYFATESEARAYAQEHGIPPVEVFPKQDDAQRTKFADWKVPGGENYREVLLTLPDSETTRRARLDRINDRIDAIVSEQGVPVSEMEPAARAEIERLTREHDAIADAPRGDDYRSSHWITTPNVLAHLRVDDRTGPAGERILFVQEIQSDWGQEGRKSGFGEEPNRFANMDYTIGDTAAGFWEIRWDDGSFHGGYGSQDAAQRAAEEIKNLPGRDRTPEAPFVTDTKSWVSLAVKRALVMAAEGGYDQVAFVRGEQAAELYNLEKRIGELAYWRDEDGDFGLSAVTPDGETIFDQHTVKEADLEGVVGKEVAQRMLDGEGVADSTHGFRQEPGVTFLRGEGLRVEAKGMRDFYDKILPQVARKVLKPLKGRTGHTEILVPVKDAGQLDRAFLRAAESMRESGMSREDAMEAMRQAYLDFSENEIQGAVTLTYGGTPSNQFTIYVTPELAGQVTEEGLPLFSREADTQAFHNWFGDSRVVDDQGQPLRMYHGTGGDFAVFQGRGGEHGWFTSDPEMASRYADQEGGSVMPVYLSIQNPASASLANRHSVMQLREMGYDGVFYRDSESGHMIGYTFSPEQIKSAIGNRGAFDPVNPDIRFSQPVLERQEQAQGAIAKGQPIDRVFRFLFDATGSLDSRGRFKPGVKLEEGFKRALLEWKPSQDGAFSWMNPILASVRAGLIDRYGLTPEFLQREFEAQAEASTIIGMGEKFLKQLAAANVGPAEARVLQRILNGEDVGDAHMRQLAAPIRQAIDDLGQELVSLNLLPAETYHRHLGKYLHRSYLKYETRQEGLPKWRQNIMRKHRRKIHGDELKARGLKEDVTTERLLRDLPPDWWGRKLEKREADKQLVNTEWKILDLVTVPGEGVGQLEGVDVTPQKPHTLRRVFWPADMPVPDRMSDYTDRGTWKVTGTRGNKLRLRRDFTKEERESMGEVLDARYNILKTFQLMSHDIANGRFFQDIAQNTEWAVAQPPSDAIIANPQEARRLRTFAEVDWVWVPDSSITGTAGVKQWGALAGMYVRPEVWRDLNEMDKMQSSGTWRDILNQWKINKTARSPVVHMNNVMSNFVLMDLIDVRLQDLKRGIAEYLAGGEMFVEARDNGAFGASFVRQELDRNFVQPLLEEILQQGRDARDSVEGRTRFLSNMGYSIWDKVKKADRKLVDMYQLEDELFRMATFMRHRSMGASPQEAAMIAREQFLNYDIRAPWINAARRTVLPFISYTYRAVPAIAQAIMHRPWKLAKYITLGYLANMLAFELAPGDEDEERRTMRDPLQGMTWASIPATDIGVHRMIRMPWVDQHDNPYYLDVWRWMPAGDVFDTNQGQLGVPAWLQWGGPMQLAFELTLNRSAFTGRDIVDRDIDTLGQATAKRADYLWKAWMPSATYIPGSWHFDKAWSAFWGERDILGRPYNIPAALASGIGVKVQPHDVQLGYYYRGNEIERNLRAVQREARQIEMDAARGIGNPIQRRRDLERVQQKIERLQEDAATLRGQ